MLATLLGASIGVPYVVSQTNHGSTAPGAAPAAQKSAWPTWGSAASSTATSPPPLLSPSGTNPYTPTTYPAATYPATTSMPLNYPTTATPAPLNLGNPQGADSVRFHSIREVFRFDVTKEWIYQNWDRKSTGLSDPQLFGIRVALVTGTQRSDLAGSLTYLFDSNGQVQHISFRGRTADTTPLVQFLAQTYQLQRMEAPAGEQLYQVRSGKDVFSELRTRPESVLLETTPQGSIGVVLELGRPGSKRALTPAAPPMEIPQVASPPTATTVEAAKEATPEGEAPPGIVGKFRPATQSEHNQVFDHRWPN
jgi:hypothetical protein